jgi:hypothetical protein
MRKHQPDKIRTIERKQIAIAVGRVIIEH